MSSTRTFGNGVEVNDSGEVIATDTVSSGNKVRIYNATVIGLSGNDPDGNPITYTIASGPSNGTLGPIQGNIILYTPNTGFTGNDSFTYKATDGTAQSVVGTVTLLVVDPTHTPFTGITRLPRRRRARGRSRTRRRRCRCRLPIRTETRSPTRSSAGRRMGRRSRCGQQGDLHAERGYFGADSFTFSASDGLLSSTATAVIPIWATGGANNQPSVSDLSATFATVAGSASPTAVLPPRDAPLPSSTA